MRPLSSWTNLQDVFAANRGQGQRMNDAVYAPLEQAGQEALGRLQNASSGFRTAAARAGDRNQFLPGGGQRYDAPTVDQRGGQSNVDRNQTVSLPSVKSGGYVADDNAYGDAQARNSAAAAARAKAAYDQTTKTLGQTKTTAEDTYKGPRTLSEYDPGIAASIGDAAARINASPLAQFQTTYKNTTAGGGALDRAVMGAEGGIERRQALEGKFGSIMQSLRDEQAAAQKLAGGYSDKLAKSAAEARGKLPELEQLSEKQKSELEKADELARRDAERAAYDRQWFEQNAAIARNARNRPNGGRRSEIQRVYDPPVY